MFEIWNGWYIDANSRNYILKRCKQAEPEETSEEEEEANKWRLMYFNNLESLFIRLYKLMLAKDVQEAETIEDLKNKILETKEEIKKIIFKFEKCQQCLDVREGLYKRRGGVQNEK